MAVLHNKLYQAVLEQLYQAVREEALILPREIKNFPVRAAQSPSG